jgi:hypothetical protein
MLGAVPMVAVNQTGMVTYLVGDGGVPVTVGGVSMASRQWPVGLAAGASYFMLATSDPIPELFAIALDGTNARVATLDTTGMALPAPPQVAYSRELDLFGVTWLMQPVSMSGLATQFAAVKCK